MRCWFGLRQVTAQFPQPICLSEARSLLPSSVPLIPSATALVARRRRRHGGDELAARREASGGEEVEATSSDMSTFRLRPSVHVSVSFQFSSASVLRTREPLVAARLLHPWPTRLARRRRAPRRRSPRRSHGLSSVGNCSASIPAHAARLLRSRPARLVRHCRRAAAFPAVAEHASHVLTQRNARRGVAI